MVNESFDLVSFGSIVAYALDTDGSVMVRRDLTAALVK